MILVLLPQKTIVLGMAASHLWSWPLCYSTACIGHYAACIGLYTTLSTTVLLSYCAFHAKSRHIQSKEASSLGQQLCQLQSFPKVLLLKPACPIHTSREMLFLTMQRHAAEIKGTDQLSTLTTRTQLQRINSRSQSLRVELTPPPQFHNHKLGEKKN